MAETKITYSSNTAITFDISSLAESSTFLAGRECTQIDNTTNLYIDALVDVKPITSHATTVNVVGQYIGLWLWGSDVSLGTTPIDVLDGTDSAETLSSLNVLNALRRVGTAAATVVTANKEFFFQPFSVASAFGGRMPKFWGLYLAHNLGDTLAASQTLSLIHI